MTGHWPPPRLPLPALAGTAALALAGWLALGSTPRWQADAAQARADLRQRAQAAAVAAASAPQHSGPGAQLVPALPPSAQLPQRIGVLMQLAQQQDLRLDSVRQQPAQRLGQGGAELEAEGVPVRMTGSGSYTAWRRLVAEALQQDGALVLDELRLSRHTPADRLLSGTLQWQLLQRPSAALSTGATP